SGVEYHLISFEKTSAYESGKNTIQDICDKYHINWVPLSYTKNPPVISTLFDIRKLRKKVLELCNAHEFDLVHCRSYISSLIGLELKQDLQIPFLFDMRGFWADERVEGGIWNINNPLYKIIFNYFKKKEKAFFQNADKIVCLTENGKQEILSWNMENVDDSKIIVIPCCADLSLFDYHRIDQNKTNALAESLKIDNNDLVISYLGAIGTWYMLEEMLDFYKVFAQKFNNTKFLFITAEAKETILSSAEQKGINTENIIVKKSKREDVPVHLSLSQICIFFIKPVYSKKASSPTKQGEIMGLGLPIICNHNVGDTDMIIEDSSAGAIVTEFSVQNYQQVCEKVPELLKLDKNKIRAGAEKFYSLDRGVEKYFSIYKMIT
ncbi:MAG: glycosyltransferase, partial [Bacteroidia bacterium]|nr:glycosyltransferase [Bacteroidia bacterium]